MSHLPINQNITRFRQEKRMTQEELAKRIGVTNQAVSKWESGKCCPDIELLPKLASLLGTSIDELMGYQASAKTTHQDKNSLLLQAIKLAEEKQQLTTAILQRALGLGYSKANALLDTMLEKNLILKDETKPYNSYLYQKPKD